MSSDDDLRDQLQSAGRFLDHHSTPVDPAVAMASGRNGQPRHRRWIVATAVASVVVVAAGALAVRWSDDNNAAPLHTSGTESSTTDAVRDGCGTEAIVADVDGDHRADRISQAIDSRGTNVIRVCLAAGQELTAHAGNGDVFNTIDVEPDGQSEIVVGGTTVSAAYSSILRVVSGQLLILSANAKPLELTDGALRHSADAVDVTESAAFGCEDVSGDSRRELTQVNVTFDGTEAAWTKTGYEIAGATATQVYIDQGTAALPPDRLNYAQALTKSCFPSGGPGATTTAVCDPYLEYLSRGQDEAAALQASLPSFAPPEVQAAVEHAQATHPGDAVTVEDRENLHFWIAQQCESVYLKHVRPAATTDQAAQGLFDAVVAGDRSAAISAASTDALAVFDHWGSPLEGPTSLEPGEDGTYRLHLGPSTDYIECHGWDGVIRDCSLTQQP